jgi:hypothetical protein
VERRQVEVGLPAGVRLLPTLLLGMKISNCARYECKASKFLFLIMQGMKISNHARHEDF